MISTKAHSEPKKLELKIDNINIEYVNFFNFLSLTIDSRLTWENHTINMSNKCLIIIGTLNRIKYFVPLNIRLLYYKRRSIYLCSAKDPVLQGSQSRRVYRRKGTIVNNREPPADSATTPLSH